MSIKSILKKNYYLYHLALTLFLLRTKLGGAKINNKGCAKLSKSVIGKNNIINIGKNSLVKNLDIYIFGVIKI